MSVLKRHAFARPWALNGPQGLAPAFASGAQMQFNLSGIPPLWRGKYANYLPCLALTAYGTITTDQAAGNASKRVSWEDLVVALYQNFDMVGAWHGRPLNNQAMRAATARIWELIAMGYQSGSRHLEWLYSSGTGRAFRHTVYLPLSFLLGDDPLYSAQMSILYENAQLNILQAGNGTLLPSGDTVVSLVANVRCSAVLVPMKAMRLAPGQEWVEQIQQGATAGSNVVMLQSFGDNSALDGVQPGAGITTMLALTAYADGKNGPGGSFTADQLTQFSAPFLEITETQHLDPFVQMLEQASRAGQPPRSQYVTDYGVAAVPSIIGEVTDISGFPYGPEATGYQSTNILDSRLLCFPMVVPGSDLQMTKIPTFGETVNYYRSVSALVGTIDRTLYHQVKSWQPNKISDFVQLCISRGIPQALFGTTNIEPSVVLNDSATTVDPAAARFLPVEFVPAKAKTA